MRGAVGVRPTVSLGTVIRVMRRRIITGWRIVGIMRRVLGIMDIRAGNVATGRSLVRIMLVMVLIAGTGLIRRLILVMMVLIMGTVTLRAAAAIATTAA